MSRMSNMETLVEQQNTNLIALQNAISNYKKSPKDRKTREYITKYEKVIDDHWETFQRLDNKLRNELPENHAYFTKELYTAMGEKYAEVKSIIENDLKLVQSSSTAGNLAQSQENNHASTSGNSSATTTDVGTKAPQQSQDNKDMSTTGNNNTTSTNIQGDKELRNSQIVPNNIIIQRQQKIIKLIQTKAETLIKQANSMTSQFVELQLQSIRQHWSYAQNLHEQLCGNVEYNLDSYIEAEVEINDKIFQIMEILETLRDNNASSHSQVKLPQIDLPKFEGDYLKWQQFYDLFNELVHKSNLSACQKMIYLKSSLSGEALSLISHFTTTAVNYDAAWKVLTERYNNKRIIVNTILAKLLHQPRCQSENAESLKLLHDVTSECLLSLKGLNISTDNWDPMLVHILTQNLSKASHVLWEQSLTDPRGLPTIKEFLEFLLFRFQSLEALQSTSQKTIKNMVGATATIKQTCGYCDNDHPIYRCSKFLELIPEVRLKVIQKLKRCVKCFKMGHNSKACNFKNCATCDKKHNTLVHLPTIQRVTSTTASCSYDLPVLLSTARVHVIDKYGHKIPCRALLDSGSQANFVSKRLAGKIGLKINPEVIGIEGIGQSHGQTRGRINLEVISLHTGFSTRIEAHILPHIVSTQPAQEIDSKTWNIPQNIKLSDEMFTQPGTVDLLLGAGIFYTIMSVGQISLGDDLPTLQNTLLGWIVGGKYKSNDNIQSIKCGVGLIQSNDVDDANLEQSLERFWKIEEAPFTMKNFTASEARIEANYLQTVRRNHNGRYIVKLPFVGQPSELGESKDIARQRFYSIERKLEKDPTLKHQYVEFMKEYLELGHMSEANLKNISPPYYFLPHHAVLKPESSTTKCRVVFDASAKTSTNVSLNEILAAGPVLQDDLFTILMRFRTHRFVFTADITKMYRQILIHEDDKQFQLIWWRDEPTKELKCYQLNTVTYGTTSAPYLAIKTLRTLAEEGKIKYPLAAQAIMTNFYVDDVLTGSDHMPTAQAIQNQLIQLLGTAGLKLRKWSANHSNLLKGIPEQDWESVSLFQNEGSQSIKTMGLLWNPSKDSFNIKIDQQEAKRITKRTALSDLSQLFDPLGFLAPVVVTAKIFIQELWKLKIDWDAALPQELHTRWIKYREELKLLKDICVDRHLFGSHTPHNIQLHIFADASERAYGAVAYSRIVIDRTIIVRFVCAKSKVAPTKQISLPKLELCAALLAAELRQKLQTTMNVNEVYLWTDSTIVLSWIYSEASHYHTFVANRISSIQRLSMAKEWRHVGTKENPADIVSRGLMPSQLLGNNFWFFGPRFLHGDITVWPLQPPREEECEVERRSKQNLALTITTHSDDVWSRINHKNCFRRLQRITAYLLRIKNKHPKHGSKEIVPTEMESALITIVKYIQCMGFKEELVYARKYKSFNPQGSLSSLTPFFDENGIVRVGGRLENSNLNYDTKHPMLLPASHPFVKLLMTTVHEEHLHTGAQSLLGIVRQRFWPLKGKNLARSVVQSCVRCVKAKPKLLQQMMGDLPADRVQPARPFTNSGVDFFGPIWIHYKIRGKRPTKAYVAVFCCFATKAIHMEVVSDLSTDAFVGALKRFIARRGCPHKIYCDNATNFVGAHNQLQEMEKIIHQEQATHKIISECSKRNIEFIFIPASAPHFGGLWEAAVKSAKHLLRSVISSATLTYEEIETIIIEAEAILNSRPLTPLSNNADDLAALTPGHFLIGEPLTTMPNPSAKPRNITTLERWKLVTHIKCEFWRRWLHEYLCCLQQRYKWKGKIENIKPGTMVLIKNENTPPLKWPLGRVVNTIQGADGLVRVVDVQTATNLLRRPIHKLAPLPIEEANEREQLHDVNNVDDTVEEQVHEIDNTLEEPIPRKRVKRRLGSTLLTTLLAILFIPAVKGLSGVPQVTVQNFDVNPGVYFEKMGPARLVISEWKLVAYIDLHPYWINRNLVKNYLTTIETNCKGLNEKACMPIVRTLQQQFKETILNDRLLQPSIQGRQKRGAVNIVGKLANTLFGVLDSEYAEQTAAVIKEIQQDETNLVMHLRNQTSFLDATLSVIQQEQKESAAEFERLQTYLNNIHNQINGLGQQIQDQQLDTRFTLLVIQTMASMRRIERIQDSLLDILIDTHHGKINPELLSPDQLHNELIKIRNHLPTNLRLPISSEDILDFYQILRIKGRLVDEMAIFQIILPLSQIEDFELIGVHPIPWTTNSDPKVNILIPAFPFYMVTLHNDQFCPLSEWEFTNCKIVGGNIHLCHPSHPIYKQESSVGRCEMQLLIHQTFDKTCNIELIERGPFWRQMYNPDKWIFALTMETKINAVCDGTVQQFTLRHAGILSLNGYCTIKEPSVTIQGHQTSAIRNYVSIIPNVNLNKSKTTNFTTAPRYNSAFKVHNELTQLRKEVNEFRLDQGSINGHDVHHYAVSWSCVILVIILLTVTVGRYWQRRRFPVPAIRRKTETTSEHPNHEEMLTI